MKGMEGLLMEQLRMPGSGLEDGVGMHEELRPMPFGVLSTQGPQKRERR